MVLAIGLLVDDAIVVVENVERLMTEEGLSPLEATRKSMDQITGALVGIGLVLAAVFVPMAFLGGSTGVIYRQFTATIVSAMALSVLVAIVLTPALCATMLKPLEKGDHRHGTGFFGWFNRKFDRGNRATRAWSAACCRAAALPAGVRRAGGGDGRPVPAPADLLPARRGPGRAVHQVQTPVGATQERTADGDGAGREALPDEREGRRRLDVRACRASASPAAARTPAWRSCSLKDWDERSGGDPPASTRSPGARWARSARSRTRWCSRSRRRR